MAEHGFDGRVALITGAAGDIGRAVAVALARGGADVVLLDQDTASGGLAEAAAACESSARSSVRVVTATVDVCDEEGVERQVAAVTERLGVPTLVVNSAGYQGQFANVADYDAADLRRVMEVNVLGVFVVVRAAARAIRDAGVGGSIVNVASMAATGAPNMPAYSASKGAVVSLTRAAAKDLASSDIRVNSVSPAFIGPGAMWDRQVGRQASVASQYYGDDATTVAEQMIGQVPLRRYGSLDEVASTICFLLSDASSYVTGIDLPVAGGAS